MDNNLDNAYRKVADGSNTRPDNWKYYLTFFLILFVLLIFLYLYFYKKNLPTGIPGEGGFATSSRNQNSRPSSTPPRGGSATSTASSTSMLPGQEQLFYIIWPYAISGFDIYSSSTVFQDKSTGHIYQADAPDYKAYKIANTTIGNLFLSQIAQNSTIIFQTMSDDHSTLSTYIADIPPYNGSPSNLINRAYLGDNVKSFALNSNKSKLAYIIENKKTWESEINILDLSNRKIRLLIKFPLTGLRLTFNSTNTISFYQAPDKDKVGESYIVNLSDGILRPVQKSRSLIYNPYDDLILYNDHTGLYMSHGKTNYKLGFDTNSDKCTVSAQQSFIVCGVDTLYNSNNPNDYLKNITIYKDKLYMRGVDYPEERLIYDSESYNNITLHLYQTRLSEDSQNLYMMDKLKGYYMLKLYSILNAESE